MFGKFRRRRLFAQFIAKQAALVVVVCALIVGGLTLFSLRSEAWVGRASWYDLSGNVTASGDVLTESSWTAAHRSFPFGSELTVCYGGTCLHNVVINDWGPAAWTGNDLDLHAAPAAALGLTNVGVDYVRYRREIPGHWDGVYVTPAGSGKWLYY